VGIRAPLGQARLGLVLAAPGDDRQARSSSVLSRSVVTRRVMNEAQSCSIVPTLVEARTTKGRLGGSDADSLLRRVDVNIALRELLLPSLGFSRVVVEGRSRALVLTACPGLWGSSRRFVANMADPGRVSRPLVPPRRQGARSAHPLHVRRHTLAHYSSCIIPSLGEATCCS